MYVFGSGRVWGWVSEMIGFGFYQSWRNMGKVGYVCVLVAVVWVVLEEWVFPWARVLEGGVVLCLCVL